MLPAKSSTASSSHRAIRGELRIKLHRDLDTILAWIERTGKSGYKSVKLRVGEVD